jgi:hypothetical protein
MGHFNKLITNSDPIGFLVHIQQNQKNLSTAELCNASGLEIMEVISLLKSSSGFDPEPPDAVGFFLFENNAENFADAILAIITT